jgi:hypothetical protein
MNMKKLTYKQVAKIAQEVVNENWITEEDVKSDLQSMLVEAKPYILIEILGLRKSFGEWSMVNGGLLDKTSPLHTRLIEISSDIWSKFLDETPIELSKSQMAGLNSAFTKSYIYTLEEEICFLAEKRARVDAQSVFDKFMSDPEE